MATKTLADFAAEIDRYGHMDFKPTWQPDGEWPAYPRIDDLAEPDKAYEALCCLESVISEIRSIAWSAPARPEAERLRGVARGHMERISAESGLMQIGG